MTTDLHQRYEALAARKPELRPQLFGNTLVNDGGEDTDWWWIGLWNTADAYRAQKATRVYEHMFTHLTAKLPNNRGLHHGDRGWSISRCGDDGRWECESVCIDGDPLTCLLNYYEKESTQ